MIGQLDTSEKKATVIGAGIAGLLAAYYLDQAGYEVTLLEKSPRAGGLIETKQTPYGIAETAVHSFLASPAVLELAQELKLELLQVNPDSKARYIFRGGKLRRFPLTARETLTALLRSYFILAQAKEPWDLNLEDWGKRHFGKGVVDYLLSPALTGIYAASPAQISLGAAFPSLFVPKGHSFWSDRLSRALRSSRKAEPKPRSKMMSFKEGSGALVDALSSHLRARLGSRFRLGVETSELPAGKNLVLCVPAHEAGKLLHPLSPKLSQLLAQVTYSPLVAATAFYPTAAFPKPVRGVGVLIPKREDLRILGVLFNSSSFSYRVSDPSHVSLTTMMGGSEHPESIQWPDSEVKRTVVAELGEILGAQGEPLHLEISRWPQAIPRYNSHLVQTWKTAQETWCGTPGHLLFGNYTGQVSVRGMIESARQRLGKR